MDQLNNQVHELEKVKERLLDTYVKYNNPNIPYTDEQLTFAATQIYNFLGKLNNMLIYENNLPRKLNNLELFAALYEFVANRIYVEQDTSHDLIGTLITNKGVCQGYCQLMSFLCETFNIPFLYKRTETYDENDIPLGSHANFEVIIQDENGFNHCLHCDPTIDSPKNEGDILGYNAFLIQDNDVNRYYHKQIPVGSNISGFYNNFSSKQTFEQFISSLTQVNPIEKMTSGKTDDEIINNHFNVLKNNLIELNNFFRMNIEFNGIEGNQLIDIYRAMYEYYTNISQPFTPEELTKAIKNVKTFEVMYERHLSYDDASLQSEKIYEQRIKKSISQHEKFWDSDGISFIYMESKRDNGPAMK